MFFPIGQNERRVSVYVTMYVDDRVNPYDFKIKFFNLILNKSGIAGVIVLQIAVFGKSGRILANLT